jgi:hypothetical protein
MANDLPPGWTPAYWAFHAWLRSNHNKLKAGRDRTVIYSGMRRGDVPVFKKLGRYRSLITAYFGVDPQWETLEFVLKKIKVDWDRYRQTNELDEKMVKSYRWMWDFAMEAPARRFVSPYEGRQIWKNLSAWYVKNAVGKVYIWEGATLKAFPDFLLAEIPILLKNKNVTPETIKRAVELAPKSAEAWRKYRDLQASKNRLEAPQESVATRS